MALIKCAECGNEVSDSAVSCPKCGAPVAKAPTGGARRVGCLTSALVIFALLVFIGYLTDGIDDPASHTSTTSAAPTIPSTGNRAHDVLLGQSEAERRTTLTSFLSGSEWKCSSVTDTFFQGLDHENTAAWNVRCSNGTSYAISIAADSGGSTRIVDCVVLGAVGVKCFTKF